MDLKLDTVKQELGMSRTCSPTVLTFAQAHDAAESSGQDVASHHNFPQRPRLPLSTTRSFISEPKSISPKQRTIENIETLLETLTALKQTLAARPEDEFFQSSGSFNFTYDAASADLCERYRKEHRQFEIDVLNPVVYISELSNQW